MLGYEERLLESAALIKMQYGEKLSPMDLQRVMNVLRRPLDVEASDDTKLQVKAAWVETLSAVVQANSR